MAETEQKVKRRRKSKNYLNNADLLDEVLKSKDLDQMTDKFVRMLMLLTDRIAKKPNYANYTYLDDMKAYALMSLVKTWSGFNPERSSNPFAYYTQNIKNSFKQYLKQEKKQRNIRDELLVKSGMTPSHTFMTEYEQNQRDKVLSDEIVDLEVDPVESYFT